MTDVEAVAMWLKLIEPLTPKKSRRETTENILQFTVERGEDSSTIRLSYTLEAGPKPSERN